MPARRPRRRNTGDSELRRYIAEQATIEHEATFGRVLREFAGDLGGDEHRARLEALAAGELVDIRFGWLPGEGTSRLARGASRSAFGAAWRVGMAARRR
jgi:hypothetical protein